VRGRARHRRGARHTPAPTPPTHRAFLHYAATSGSRRARSCAPSWRCGRKEGGRRGRAGEGEAERGASATRNARTHTKENKRR
jgi:hypothetical protein